MAVYIMRLQEYLASKEELSLAECRKIRDEIERAKVELRHIVNKHV